ncbi:hypothetical protein EXM65_17330 [Clostridium botulinum]|uniref:Uncharacterized protein n=1 Tax=Clostridium botulinum TaxID=1491 RepID=A0A6M0SSM9_CLOBO|nr:hypothetical protein [Clostridium botulinum]
MLWRSFENIPDIYEQNRIRVLNDENFKQLVNDIKRTKEFIYNFDFLNFNRRYHFDGENCDLANAHTLLQ